VKGEKGFRADSNPLSLWDWWKLGTVVREEGGCRQAFVNLRTCRPQESGASPTGELQHSVEHSETRD